MPADMNPWAENDSTSVGLTPDIQAVLATVLAEDQADRQAADGRQLAEHRAGQARARQAVDAIHVRDENAKVDVSPAVRVQALRERVYLANVTGTGAGGRITVDDVRAHAELRRPLAAVAASGGRFPDPAPEAVTPHATYPGWLAAARKVGPEPTLFATGNLPPFTASGLDVSQLRSVPWQARPAMATAPTLAAAYAIVDDVLSDPDPEAFAAELFARHDAVQDYTASVISWLAQGQHEQLMSEPIQYPGPRQAGRVPGY
ncbi:MAG: hypothetical protein JWP40_976 [Blastococcus sp.]|nr:hypothetical protein [Blastococcus sp.]